MSEAKLRRARLVVLISGSGSNLQAILDACSQNQISAEVVAVISNQPQAYGLKRAEVAGVPALAFPKAKELDRRAYDALLAQKVAAFQPDWVVLAGWMRILSNEFLSVFPQRVINLHPALPGTFPGTHAIERAYEAFLRGELTQTGVMVHRVPDEGVDNGPVLGQAVVPMISGESLEALEVRVHETEHRLLLEVIAQVLHEAGFYTTKE